MLKDSESSSRDNDSAKLARLTSNVSSSKRESFARRNSFTTRPSMPAAFKFSDALEKAENDNADEKDSIEDLRISTKKFMTHSALGKNYENLMLTVSVLSTLEFIYATYLEPANKFDEENKAVLVGVEFFFATMFSFDWTLEFLLADRKGAHLWSFLSIVDLTTIIPIFVSYGLTEPDYEDINTTREVFIYILFLLKTTRILRALRLLRKLDSIHDAVDRYIGEISLSISVMILFFASVMQFLEKSVHPYPFHTWMYYIWVTISTVGYGDITPWTPTGRFAAMAMIGFAIISVPKMTNGLIEKMSLQSVYARAVYTPKSKTSRHIVICGDLSSTALADFFEELFHEDHENADLNAVILLPSPPSVEIVLMLRDPKYFLSLSYLQGSSLVDADLKRAKAESAVALFIMANKFSSVPDEEDAKSVLQNLSIKRYLSSSRFPRRADPLYCMQLIRPENLRQLSRNSAGEVEESNLVVCLNEIKMGVLARAVVYPGANTFIMNLITSFSDDAFGSDDEGDDGGAQAEGGQSSNAWLKEYQKGCDWEIYTTSLSDIFVGAKFSELSLALYEKLGVVLFALQLTSLKKKGRSKLLLNPANYLIPNKTEYRIEAFVIAKNKASSDLSFGRGGQQDHNAFTAVADNITQFANNVLKTNVTDYVPESMFDRRKSSLASGMSDEQLANATGKKTEKEEGSKPKKASLWNSLKRSSLLDKKVQTFSYQEILQRLEDEHFQKFYYLRPTAVELSDVTVRTSVIEEIPFINNHIIVIGKELSNLYDLIKPLRAKYLGNLKYIVILYPYDIPYDVWQRICMFDAVLVVRGSPLEETNLRRAGIFRAQQVVVLAEGSNSASEASGMEALVDSDAIFAYQCVKRMNPSAQIVIEIVNQSNIGYLVTDTQGSISPSDHKFSNQFAAGTLFTTALLDSLVCQAYYNPHIIKVVNKLISGVDQMERAGLSDQAVAEAAASQGETAVNSDDDEDDEVFDASTGSTVKGARRNKMNEIKGSCLYQIAMPENFVKKTYGNLYQHLAMQGIIPLGLLRGTLTNLNIGPKSNKMPYVYTNPEKSAELYQCDRVFVLALTPQSTQGKSSVKDWLLDIQMQKNREKEVAAAAPAVGVGGRSPSMTSHAGGAGPSAAELQASQKKLEEKLSKLSTDVNKKFNSIVSLLKAVITHLPGTENIDLDELIDGSSAKGGAVRGSRSYSTDTAATSGGGGRERRFSVDSSSSAMTRDSDDVADRESPSMRVEAENTRLNSVINPNGSQTAQPTQSALSPMFNASPNGILRKSSKVGDGIASFVPQKKRHSFSEPVVTDVSILRRADDSDNAADSEHSGGEEHKESAAEIDALGRDLLSARSESRESVASGHTAPTETDDDEGDESSDEALRRDKEEDDGGVYIDSELSETPDRFQIVDNAERTGEDGERNNARDAGYDAESDAVKPSFAVKAKPEPKVHRKNSNGSLGSSANRVRPATADSALQSRTKTGAATPVAFSGPPLFLAKAAENRSSNNSPHRARSFASPQRAQQYAALSQQQSDADGADGGNGGESSTPKSPAKNLFFAPSSNMFGPPATSAKR